ncbi:uncharacterized protein C8Q71DRAFT_863333 [Rhodofomes roseus]|uniref:Uncharacterized protein n=1 Tax=Rhodofomes roseus TaxID=34475 RepID=A0ABQ8JZB5_9APHY|nr:uncharacterized protein C8Q71DRAFT_863333 [Rhodofomes roseus]KAH9829406.1 hypothetical protein C8Q71DRAFT_863333 [Rhodofomes roseus]
MLPPCLPLELWDRAIDHLWNDCAALEARRLTCHAWFSSAHVHVFRNAEVHLHCEQDCDTLANLTAPHTAHPLRLLSIVNLGRTASFHAEPDRRCNAGTLARRQGGETDDIYGYPWMALSKPTLAAMEAITWEHDERPQRITALRWAAGTASWSLASLHFFAETYGVQSHPALKFFPSCSKGESIGYDRARREGAPDDFLSQKCGTYRAVGGDPTELQNAGCLPEFDTLRRRKMKRVEQRGTMDGLLAMGRSYHHQPPAAIHPSSHYHGTLNGRGPGPDRSPPLGYPPCQPLLPSDTSVLARP